jgi:hypothetical protein
MTSNHSNEGSHTCVHLYRFLVLEVWPQVLFTNRRMDPWNIIRARGSGMGAAVTMQSKVFTAGRRREC